MDPVVVNGESVYVSLEATAGAEDQSFVLIIPEFRALPEEDVKIAVLRGVLPRLAAYGVYVYDELDELDDDDPDSGDGDCPEGYAPVRLFKSMYDEN